ncbi:hypothetical protein ABH15_10825 [Methanoculleus taiwanensis]|uniref:PAS domain-containing protein n=1 Tax=Methanoculleus taiwanensis TaxID=1550565 RepID=A0A498GWL8_9EURY|nr:PAS domain-containing protein [Methanoculleus taiwanensis]RXE55269.1 hypothetical protein ABH15_10825 [Methanoculleus taiwanensis]
MNMHHSTVCGEGSREIPIGVPCPDCTHEHLLFWYLDRLGDGIVLIDQDQTVVWMNRCMERLFDFNRIDTLGMNAIDFVALCIAPRLEHGEMFKERVIAASLFGEEIRSVRACIKNQNTPDLAIEYASLQLFGSSRRYARCDEYRVVPCRKPSGEAPHESERRSPFFTADRSDMVCMLDAEMQVTAASPSLRHLLGYRPSEITGSLLERILMLESIDDFRSPGAISSPGDVADEESVPAFRSMPLVYQGRDGSPVQLKTRSVAPAGHPAHCSILPAPAPEGVVRRIGDLLMRISSNSQRLPSMRSSPNRTEAGLRR